MDPVAFILLEDLPLLRVVKLLGRQARRDLARAASFLGLRRALEDRPGIGRSLHMVEVLHDADKLIETDRAAGVALE